MNIILIDLELISLIFAHEFITVLLGEINQRKIIRRCSIESSSFFINNYCMAYCQEEHGFVQVLLVLSYSSASSSNLLKFTIKVFIIETYIA